ncbi:retrovirus-related pol polyprotein from transposon TNT 1-94 [Tanacetum coccineum]|uniref:Retrovirus-related pol polyprotein from transposon TNT 1-94 n=1 Tax=Tanacetum coccineum TaxID=301880 RepID=A0ABQ5GX55_9ASTR
MEVVVQQYHVGFEIQKKHFLIENDQLLDQIISQHIVNIVVNSSLDINNSVKVNSSVAMIDYVNYVEMCNKCLELEVELIKQHNMVEKDEYNKLLNRFSELEQHCISLEIAMQLNKEIFQKNNTSVNQTEPSFDQLLELNNLKAELQAKDTTIEKLKENIKLNQLNKKSIEITDLNAQLQEKVFVITTLKNDLRKIKGKDTVDNAAQMSKATSIALRMYKLDPITLAPKDKNNRETHIYYLKHTMEQAAILREIVEQAYSINHLDSASYSTCKYVKLIQKLLGYVRYTCPDILKPSEKLVVVTPINKMKTVRLAEPVISSSTSQKQLGSSQTKTKQTTNNSVSISTGVSRSTKSSRHELCFLEFVSDMNAISKSKSVKKTKKKEEWKPTGKVTEPKTSRGSNTSVAPSSSVDLRFISTIKFGNDQIAKIMGYGDYQIGNITFSRVYYVEGLGHNLFSVGQFYDSDLEVAFRKHTCFVRNLEGDDLLSGSQKTNLYTLSMGDMMASSPICLLAKASKTKSCKKQSHKPKSEDTNQEKLYVLHMDLCGPMRVASIKEKKYILVIVDDYSWFTWVKFLASKDEAPDFIIKFLKMIQVKFNTPIRKIRTDNEIEFANQTLRSYYESVDGLPVVEPNQHDDVPVVPEHVLVDEDEDPEEEEFEEEEEPQEEKDDMEVDIEEDDNEPKLTYTYEEVDPLNPPSPASELEPEDVNKVEDTNSDGLLPGLMRRDINSLFGRIASLSRRLCGRETAHALVEKKGKAKDEYYGKLILDLGNEVRSSVEEGMAAIENLVRKLGNAEEKTKCKKLKKELEEARFSNTLLCMLNERVGKDLYWTRVRAHEFYREMICRGFVFEERPNEAIDVPIEDEKSPSSEPRGSPHDSYRLDAIGCNDIIKPPKFAPLTQAAVRRMIKESVDAAIAAERARHANAGNDARGSGLVRGQDATPVVREYTFAGFMKCNPTIFRDLRGFIDVNDYHSEEVDINKKTENQAKMTKLSMEWKRLCKIKANKS